MVPAASPLGIVDDHWLLVRDGMHRRISCPHKATIVIPPGVEVVDGHGGLLTPGLIDCHTHLVFAGDRSAEFVRRCQGASYEAVGGAGGRHSGHRASDSGSSVRGTAGHWPCVEHGTGCTRE